MENKFGNDAGFEHLSEALMLADNDFVSEAEHKFETIEPSKRYSKRIGKIILRRGLSAKLIKAAKRICVVAVAVTLIAIGAVSVLAERDHLLKFEIIKAGTYKSDKYYADDTYYVRQTEIDNAPKSIEKIYTLSLPERFVLKDTSDGTLYHKMTWYDGTTAIYYNQYTLSATFAVMPKIIESRKLEADGAEIIYTYRKYENIEVTELLWHDAEYSHFIRAEAHYSADYMMTLYKSLTEMQIR